MGAIFNKYSAIQNQDAISMLDRANAVRDEEDRASEEFLGQIFADEVFGGEIQCASSLVKNKQSWALEHCAGNGYALTLAS